MRSASCPGESWIEGAASLAVLWLLLVLPPLAWATDQYALLTGRACGACHLDPGGGGRLTEEGAGFQRALRGEASAAPPSPAVRLVRFVAGYLHLFTAILWFGTILYVHVILRPAYAAQGLPRAEMRLGLFSMVAVGVTGTVLAILRLPSLDALFHSRFGILLTVKVSLFLVMVTSAMVVVVFIRPRLQAASQEAAVPARGDMTRQELSTRDGRQGRPAYIAYDGQIYDVGGATLWRGGVHFVRHRAGEDLTTALPDAPHGEEMILKLPRVGSLLEAPAGRVRPAHETVFYSLAYMNLGLVIAITLIVAFWRWW